MLALPLSTLCEVGTWDGGLGVLLRIESLLPDLIGLLQSSTRQQLALVRLFATWLEVAPWFG
jgi:hypothetical protein